MHTEVCKYRPGAVFSGHSECVFPLNNRTTSSVTKPVNKVYLTLVAYSLNAYQLAGESIAYIADVHARGLNRSEKQCN